MFYRSDLKTFSTVQDLAVLDALEAQHHARKRARSLHQQQPFAPASGQLSTGGWRASCAPPWPVAPAQPLAQLWPQHCSGAAKSQGSHDDQRVQAGAAEQQGILVAAPAVGNQLLWQPRPPSAGLPYRNLAGVHSQTAGTKPKPPSGAEGIIGKEQQRPCATGLGGTFGGEPGVGAGLHSDSRPLAGGGSWRPGPPCERPNPVRASAPARQTNVLQGGRADGAISVLHGGQKPRQPLGCQLSSSNGSLRGLGRRGDDAVVDLTLEADGRVVGEGEGRAGLGCEGEGDGTDDVVPSAEAGTALDPLVQCSTTTHGIRVHRSE